MKLLTLQNIKDQYYVDLVYTVLEHRSFEQYLRDEYKQVYNKELNFIGWDRK